MFQVLNHLFPRSKELEQDTVAASACSELHTPTISLSRRLYAGLRRFFCPSATIIEVSWDNGKSWLPLDKDNSKQIERVRAKQTISCIDIRNDRHLSQHLTHEGVDVMIKVWLKDEHRQQNEQDNQQWTVRRVKGWKSTLLGCAEVPATEAPGPKWIYLPGPPQYEPVNVSTSPVTTFRVDSAASITLPENKPSPTAFDMQSVKKFGSKASHDFTFQCPLPSHYQYPTLPPAKHQHLAMKNSQILRHQYSASSINSIESDFDNEIESCGWRITQMQCQPPYDIIKPLRYTNIESYGAVEGVLAC